MKEIASVDTETTMKDILKMTKDDIGLEDTKDIGKKVAITGMVATAVGGALMILGKILMEND